MFSLTNKNGFLVWKNEGSQTVNMSFLPTHCEITKEQVDNQMKDLDPTEPVHMSLYVMIDYAYHHTDPDYRQGLSFFHRINDKLGKQDERTIDMLQIFVNDDRDYMHMLASLFTDEDLAQQGI